MSSLDEVPFDLDGTEGEAQGYVDQIFDLLGFETWRDVFSEWESAAPQDLRGARYSTPEEALFDLYERGMLGFSRIVYYPVDDLYGIEVDYADVIPP